MKAKISMITLGVDNLERATRFYRDGLELPQFEFDSEGVAFFDLEGTWLGLFPREALADDIGLDSAQHSGFSGITLAHNVASKAEVDAVLEQAVSAGATLIKPAQEVFWGGYSGYFQDPEGHYWEVAYNPFMDLT
ncbi:Lactoylglutathione lyase [Marinobacterium lacunae]|uniref:Lactoylglutathione lyase n=1 Tax=Marinobacterium lacunae TaxID=1232683 RepID=A0A081G1M3_9GAMM|nr:VOC family protein [Marinobacterium lacunae]KEA64678.1 Lactoylglutathione lyase [Marinobacterium lacunae]MBR9885489.1 VOC family protein [Oceanospirillales bacterium]